MITPQARKILKKCRLDTEQWFKKLEEENPHLKEQPEPDETEIMLV